LAIGRTMTATESETNAKAIDETDREAFRYGGA
jgi:hypothetical protein